MFYSSVVPLSVGPVFNLADLFEVAAETVPDRLALVAGSERRT